jgi:hypothetical protein
VCYAASFDVGAFAVNDTPSNQRVERIGGQPPSFMRAPVAAGRHVAMRRRASSGTGVPGSWSLAGPQARAGVVVFGPP